MPSIYHHIDSVSPPLPAHSGSELPDVDSTDPFAPVSPASNPPLSLSPFHDESEPSRSPPPFRRGRPTLAGSSSATAHLGNTTTSSALGNRSLMGMLGGTRLEGFGAGFGVGYGDEVLEEDEEEEEQDLSTHKPIRSGSSTSSSHSSISPDPPDFTTRIPLTPSSPSSQPHHHHRSHSSPRARVGAIHLGGGPTGILGGMGPKERALWRWINVDDLDAFLQEVYLYYTGRGIWAIALSRALNLLTIGWVIFFSTFLVGCIDYSKLWTATSLAESMVPSCVSRFSPPLTLFFLLLLAFYATRVVRFSLGVRSLWAMHEFFVHILLISEDDIQTIPWTALVSRLSELRASHPAALAKGPTSTKLDAHDVANRIMREENYLIALFNKNVLDLSVPLPLAVENWIGTEWRLGGGLTRTLEWNLSFCLLGFLFGSDGQVRRAFLSERNRAELVEALRNRFILMGVINAVFAPFIFVYLVLWSFFRYFEEYHQNPSSLSSRSFTPLARWQFREFNELPHLFSKRLAAASPLASSYLAQFPRAKTALVGRFVAFLAGSFAAVLILFSLIDPEAFLHFDVTKGRTVLFYIGVFGAILTVARGLVPDEHGASPPEELMKQIVEHTHYLPEEWKGKLHSAQVHDEFATLYQMKVVVFLQELFSVLITPFVLWYTLPKCAGPVVDFFREFTVHVDGLGYVCSFAVFDFKRHGDARFGAPIENESETHERYKSREGKMEKSFLNFTSHNPTWVPRDQTQSLYLSRMTDASVHLHPSAQPSIPRFRAGKDKSKIYDRAFQRSMLGGSRSRRPSAQEAINEESGLDGERYVATSSSSPFGPREPEADEEEEGKANDRLKGLLDEIYKGGRKGR